MARDKITVTFASKDLERQIAKALKRNPQATVKAVNTIAIGLAGESARRAPIESGDLRNNCVAELNGEVVYENDKTVPAMTPPATKAEASVGYSLPYALRQHEELKYKHDRTDGHTLMRVARYKTENGEVTKYYSEGTINMFKGGEEKFLERPYNENEAKYIALIEKIPEESLK